MNQHQLDYMRAVFFVLEETAVVRDAVEEWRGSWVPWGPFETLDQFVQTWEFLALKKSAFSDIGFFVVWDSVKNMFPDYMDEGLRQYPPQTGDSAISVMSSMLRDDGFDNFSEVLWDTASDGEGELEDSVVDRLAVWWETERESVLQSVWERVKSLELSASDEN